MAHFTGDFNDFEKFIGPRLRNIVQTKISRNYKKEIGRCEECEAIDNLEAAHIQGKDRKFHMKKSYEKYSDGKKLIDVDLIEFEQDFIESHYPLNENFKNLCKSCHRKYDKVSEQIDIFESESIIVNEENINYDTLEIQLYPNDTDEFKELLLIHKSALIKIYYSNGTIEVKEWKANRFSENSDVIGNLRSRIEFRQGNWQKLGILKVEVEINY
ncbi:hypothetical protein V2H21_07470 [Riemerella anatipestifer]|uniref:hypothetical protein n=1 Tax=Riemerella anatipestifer TaxID=34085 RepID=UPI002EBC7267|nr:hypothetical protein [Riemerella anatipestifer]MEE3725202.1 hypothetical protein [Riemerella anatipestifer]